MQNPTATGPVTSVTAGSVPVTEEPMSICGELTPHPLACGCSACLARAFEAACQANVLGVQRQLPQRAVEELRQAMQRYPALKTAPVMRDEPPEYLPLRPGAIIRADRAPFPPPEQTHPVQTKREAIADLVKRMLHELTQGSVTRSDIIALQQATTRALADLDVSRAVTKLR